MRASSRLTRSRRRLAGTRGKRMRSITLRVNGRSHTVDVEPATPLLYVLRNDLGLRGRASAAGWGSAAPARSSSTARRCARASGRSRRSRAEITTLEGLAENGRLHPLQQAWIDEQVPQCGFCQNGQILTAKVAARQEPAADRRGDPPGDGADAVPLHDLLPGAGGHQARGRRDRVGGRRRREGAGMTAFTPVPNRSRPLSGASRPRAGQFLAQSGMFVVSVAALPGAVVASPPRSDPAARALSRSRLPPARLLDRDPRRQHRDALRRQDRPGAGHRHRVPAAAWPTSSTSRTRRPAS